MWQGARLSAGLFLAEEEGLFLGPGVVCPKILTVDEGGRLGLVIFRRGNFGPFVKIVLTVGFFGRRGLNLEIVGLNLALAI